MSPCGNRLTDWQYVDRLSGLYEENGVAVNREPFGPLTGTLVPPCIGHAVAIIEGLLALEQGVRSITLGYGQAGNLIQDVAAVRSLKSLAEHYFRDAGYDDFELTTVFHQWMGGFPEDEAKAFAVIGWGTVVACLAGADKIIVKTPHEAMGVPTKEANAQGLKATRQIVSMLADQRRLDDPAMAFETAIIEREVHCILAKVFELGRGDVKEGAVAAFDAGVLDVAFAPSNCCRGKVLPMRDHQGLHPPLQPRRDPAGRRVGGLSSRPARRAGPGRRPPRLVPNGDRRHLRHQPRPAGGKTEVDHSPSPSPLVGEGSGVRGFGGAVRRTVRSPTRENLPTPTVSLEPRTCFAARASSFGGCIAGLPDLFAHSDPGGITRVRSLQPCTSAGPLSTVLVRAHEQPPQLGSFARQATPKSEILFPSRHTSSRLFNLANCSRFASAMSPLSMRRSGSP